jgi:hypothetical protein
LENIVSFESFKFLGRTPSYSGNSRTEQQRDRAIRNQVHALREAAKDPHNPFKFGAEKKGTLLVTTCGRLWRMYMFRDQEELLKPEAAREVKRFISEGYDITVYMCDILPEVHSDGIENSLRVKNFEDFLSNA